ncbi:unnamed protein product [Hyaloperonospora brassicae]|uniref:Uncharacterized protein n=1 Tax=Hyaloperonospora brassicae TaxID=162125 RepID=A0AAV0UMK1_HYABA|nr:unnamed protein product [Hyaloperonospora brassicae]
MIYYSDRRWWRLLLHANGSSLATSSTLSRAAVVVALSSALTLYQVQRPAPLAPARAALDQHLLLCATTFLAVLVSLRVFDALRRWQKGVASVGALADAVRTLMATSCAFVHLSRKSAAADHVQSRFKCQFLRDVKRFLLLYVALLFHDCNRCDASAEVRALLTVAEADAFATLDVSSLGEATWNRERNAVGSANKMRAAIVELWLRRTLNRARRKSYVTADQAMALHRLVSTLAHVYTEIFTLCNVPIAFNLAQCLHVVYVGYLLFLGAVLAPVTGLLASLYVGIAAVLLMALDDVASSIECPFGADPNAVDLEARILCIQDELKVMLQAHFRSVGHEDLFKEHDRMASLSSLLSVDVDTESRGRARHGSVSSSYSSKERPPQYAAPSSMSATDRAVLLSTTQSNAYGAIAEADDEVASPPAMHGSDDHAHIAV